jgi:hypothetical protein
MLLPPPLQYNGMSNSNFEMRMKLLSSENNVDGNDIFRIKDLRGLCPRATIQAEWPPLVGEVSVNFCGQRLSRGQRDGSLPPYSRFDCLFQWRGLVTTGCAPNKHHKVGLPARFCFLKREVLQVNFSKGRPFLNRTARITVTFLSYILNFITNLSLLHLSFVHVGPAHILNHCTKVYITSSAKTVLSWWFTTFLTRVCTHLSRIRLPGFHFYGFRKNKFLQNEVVTLASRPQSLSTRSLYLCL